MTARSNAAATARTIVGRVRRRMSAERWAIDAVRQWPRVRQLRRRLERLRVKRLARSAGSVDAALDEIVAEAVRRVEGGDR